MPRPRFDTPFRFGPPSLVHRWDDRRARRVVGGRSQMSRASKAPGCRREQDGGLFLALVDGLFQLLADAEAHSASGRNPDRFIRIGIMAAPRATLRNLKGAEPDERHLRVTPQAVGDGLFHRV